MPSYDGGDTGFLNAFFSSWFHEPAEARLPFGCNAQRTMHAFTKKQPSYWNDAVDIEILHYSSSPKPWLCPRPRRSEGLKSPKSIFWRFFDEHRNDKAFACSSRLIVLARLGSCPAIARRSEGTSSFDELMGSCRIRPGLYSRHDMKWLDNFRAAFDAANVSTIASGGAKIPKIIHQIWIGDAPIPESTLAWRQSWLELNPGFEYRLWRDADIDALPHLQREDLYSRAQSPVIKADIARWEILSLYGGVYVDVDVQ